MGQTVGKFVMYLDGSVQEVQGRKSPILQGDTS